MKTNYIATILFWLIFANANAQLLPDYEFPLVFHSASGNSDTVYLGLSSNAISGISPNLDVIDTSDFNNLVDARIYDEAVQNQIGGNCYNLKKFYQPYPSNIDSLSGFGVTYYIVFKMDSFNNDHTFWWIDFDCETYRPDFSYFSLDASKLLDFEFLNDKGFKYTAAQIVAYNFNLGGTDYYDIYSTSETCFNVSYPNYYSDGICNDVDNGLVVSIRLNFGNKFFINTEDNYDSPDYSIKLLNNNYEIISTQSDHYQLFNLQGNLVLSENITAQEVKTINTNHLLAGVYILKFQNNSLTKKIIKL